MLQWEIKVYFILLQIFPKQCLPFLSKWYFLGTMEDTRAMLFSCWLDLANDKILSEILFFRSLVLQWIMIRSGFFFSVDLMYGSISSVSASGKDLATNNSYLIDNSQPLTFLTKESATTTLTLQHFSLLFCLAFMFLLIFFTSPFQDLLVIICLPWHY